MGPTNMNTNLQQCVLLCAIWPGNRGFALRIIALFLRLRRVHFAVHDWGKKYKNCLCRVYCTCNQCDCCSFGIYVFVCVSEYLCVCENNLINEAQLMLRPM